MEPPLSRAAINEVLWWGSGPADWLSAIGTTGALALGFVILISDRVRRARSGADAFVTWKMTQTSIAPGRPAIHLVTVHAYNGGSVPIPYAWVTAPRTHPDHVEAPMKWTAMVSQISPNEKVERVLEFDHKPDLRTFWVEFVDGEGRFWRRSLATGKYLGVWTVYRWERHPARKRRRNVSAMRK